MRRFDDYIKMTTKAVMLFSDPSTTNMTKVAIQMTEVALLERELNNVSTVA